MKFDLKKPCKDCPFIKGSSTNVTLEEGRLSSIVEDIQYRDSSFVCHKTLGYDGKTVPEQHCAGALIYLERIGRYGRPNQAMRFGERFGLYKREELEIDYPNIITEEDIEKPDT